MEPRARMILSVSTKVIGKDPNRLGIPWAIYALVSKKSLALAFQSKGLWKIKAFSQWIKTCWDHEARINYTYWKAPVLLLPINLHNFEGKM